MLALFISLNALFAGVVFFVVRWRARSLSFQAMGQFIVLANELVNFRFNEAILIVEHAYMVLKSLSLGK